MKTKNSLINAITAFLVNGVIVVVNFIIQSLFVRSLGVELLGLNAVFSNILTMLGVVELGFGSAIIYHLYAAVAKQDDDQISALMTYYKKIYNYIALIVLALGILTIPFLNFFIGENNLSINIYIAFSFLLGDQVISYFLSYKRSILIALQKNYYIDVYHIICVILSSAVNFFVLIVLKNYYLFLLIKIIFRLFENVLISYRANILCPSIAKKNNRLNSRIKSNLNKQVKGLVFHSLGTFMVNGTDNILLSKFFGLYTSGLVSNYVLMTSTITTLLSQSINAIVGSIGNLIIQDNKVYSYEIFKRLLYLVTVIYAFVSISIFNLADIFIEIWLGNGYKIDGIILSSLCVGFFSLGIKSYYMLFKKTSGIFYEDKYVPVLEAFTNIIASIIFLKIFGVAGIYIGTITSHIILFTFSFPKFLYKNLFDKNLRPYIKDLVTVYLSYFILCAVSYFVKIIPIIINLYITFFVKGIFVLVIVIATYVLITYKTKEFKYYLEILTNCIRKVGRI